MLGWIIDRTKMASLAGKWVDATGIDPGDKGQVAVMAAGLMKVTGARAEDAWFSCLMKWMNNHPDYHTKELIALGVTRFLDIYGHSAGLSPEVKSAAMTIAEAILHGEYTNIQSSVNQQSEIYGTLSNAVHFEQQEKPHTSPTYRVEADLDLAVAHIEALFCVDATILPGFSAVKNEFYLLSERIKLSSKGAISLVERIVAYYVLGDAKNRIQKNETYVVPKLFWIAQLIKNSNELAVLSGDQDKINFVSAGHGREIEKMLRQFGIFI